jgi:hypothetical protein
MLEYSSKPVCVSFWWNQAASMLLLCEAAVPPMYMIYYCLSIISLMWMFSCLLWFTWTFSVSDCMELQRGSKYLAVLGCKPDSVSPLDADRRCSEGVARGLGQRVHSPRPTNRGSQEAPHRATVLPRGKLIWKVSSSMRLPLGSNGGSHGLRFCFSPGRGSSAKDTWRKYWICTTIERMWLIEPFKGANKLYS